MHSIFLPDAARERGRLAGLEKPIDPSTTAVVAIDFQRFFIDEDEPMGNQHARDILENANRVNAAVREAGGLVVITQHSRGAPGEDAPTSGLETQELRPGSRSFELHPDLEIHDDDVCLIKHRSSPLHERAASGLPELLEEHGIETIVVTGLASNGCCDCLARDAYQHEFNVVMVSDASAAMSDEEHNATLLNLAIYYAQVLDTDAIESAMQR